VKAFETGDPAKLGALLSDDIIWDEVVQPQARHGKEAAIARQQMVAGAFPDAKASGVFRAVQDFVIIETTWTGTHRGPFGPIPATHESVELHACDILRFGDDGAISRIWSYGNSMELMTQLGLAPAEPT
jgi:steroid delta-isomerase-like uncharacterized protein